MDEMPSLELDLDTELTRHFAHHQLGMSYGNQMVGNAALLPTLPNNGLAPLNFLQDY
jgi:hypothetical protein